MMNVKIFRGPVGAVFTLDGAVVATARVCRNSWWILSIPGHIWPVAPNTGTARLNDIPGDKITETPIKAFPSRAAALAEVIRILTP